jgi:hypothetical protein
VGKLLGSIINSIGLGKGAGEKGNAKILVTRITLLDGKRGWRWRRRPREKAAGREGERER